MEIKLNIIISEMELDIKFPAREIIQAANRVLEERFARDGLERSVYGVIEGVANKYSR